ncbi:hypothetical protein HON52_03800 [Candidatus Uhrbacteria bacterium]|jgi:hypothetical protein|nr:hypothetical protein [Candidatus Uhrbacteria bacterium]
MISQELISIIQKAIKRSTLLILFIGIGVSAFSLFMIWMGVTGTDVTAGAGTNIFISIVGALFLLVGGMMLYVGIRPNPVIKLLKTDPDKIVWIYELKVITPKGVASNTRKNIFFCTGDGKRYPIVTSMDAATKLYGALQTQLTKTIFGYTKERHEAFGKDPQSLV